METAYLTWAASAPLIVGMWAYKPIITKSLQNWSLYVKYFV